MKPLTDVTPVLVDHTRNASLRASIIDHLFLGELLRCLWAQGFRAIELLRAEVDAAGYDILIECNGIARHIQLKSSYDAAKTDRVPINAALTSKPSGCVVWIRFDPETMRLGPYLWLGDTPGKPVALGDRVGRHSRGPAGAKALRPNIRVVHRNSFTVLDRMEDLAIRLFGD
jgi:hypothetical protein